MSAITLSGGVAHCSSRLTVFVYGCENVRTLVTELLYFYTQKKKLVCCFPPVLGFYQCPSHRVYRCVLVRCQGRRACMVGFPAVKPCWWFLIRFVGETLLSSVLGSGGCDADQKLPMKLTWQKVREKKNKTISAAFFREWWLQLRSKALPGHRKSCWNETK